MRLEELTGGEIPGLRAVSSGDATEITGLAYDSRGVGPGTLFFCVSGHVRDGHDFARGAVDAGASGLVVERPLGLGVPEVLVESTRAAMGPLAARFYGDPTARLRVIGVTGTNGKTTTAHLVRRLIEASGERCGLLGTIESIVGGERRDATRTTPEAIDLQADFRAMLEGGERCCAMEVSSHALALGRTDATRFAAAIFTNISRDHLDFHDSMEAYFQAKRSLFVPAGKSPPPRHAVINLDDPYGRRLAEELEHPLTYAIERDADFRATDVRVELGGCRFDFHTPVGERRVKLPLPGRFNVANALGALTAVHALGGQLDAMLARLEEGIKVPGRFELVEGDRDFAVLVDYAHTPDSLENVLNTAHEVTRGQVICVFGAGGDRDRGKRPLMGEVAARLADVLVVTSDNPRSEEPEAIIAEILAGARQALRRGAAAPALSEVDRRVAIARAIELAQSGDVVVIAGKGHEQGQEFADGLKLPFDDVTVAREALGARGS